MSYHQDHSSRGKSNHGVRFKDDEKDVEMGHQTHTQRHSGPLEKWPQKMTSQISTKYKQVKKEFKRMASMNQGVKLLDRTKTTAKRALKGLEFVNKKVGSDGWAEIEKKFDQLSADGLLLRSRFGKCIGINEQEFAGELFDALARRKGIVTGTITKDQLRDFWDQLSNPSFDARMQTFFDMVDKNADGKLTEDEVRQIILVSASANQLWKVKENADEFVAMIMKALDPDGIGYIEMKNLETLFLQAPKDADSQKLNKFLGDQKLVLTKKPNSIKRATKKTTYFFQVHWKRLWVMLLWLSICVALFTWKFMQYKHRYVYHIMGNCVATAKGAAETLKFNMALILLPVCRKTITWIRSRTKLGGAVPFDDNINFHKILALAIGLGAAIHVICHLTCDFPRLLHASDEAYTPLAKYFGPTKPPNYGWFLKGTEGWTGITMVILMAIAFTLAQPWFRKNKVKLPKVLERLTGFNAFWYSHHSFVIVYALLFVHGWYLYLTPEWYKRTTWMYLSVPILLYASERLIKSLKSSNEKVEISKFNVYRENEASGNALSLQMTKPKDFEYSSGQYIFVKCMDVSPFEWHPFSLTSAPGDDYISVHIRALGDWTKQLILLFSKLEQDANGGLAGDENCHKPQLQRMPRLKIDGPYGAPAQDYKNYDVLLLVGLGIGATPLISIVKDVLYRIKQRKDIESGIEEHGAADDNNSSSHNRKKSFAVKRVYFNWVTREQGSFDWFRSIMNDVAEIDLDHVIEMHNYCSCVHKEGDARSAMFTMLQSLQDAKNGLDIVSGTRVKTHFGRANWDAVFNSVRARHPNERVGVFYCGTPALIKTLRQLSQDFSRNTATKFDFHKENF